MESPWWSEESAAAAEPIMLSMLEHFSYCPRQCALIHIEQAYDDNIFTLRGSAGHERVDEPLSGEENGVRYARAIPLFSRKWGLTGKSDLIEFPGGVPYPVEFKHSGSRGGHAEVQLCGQALCLEKMLGVAVPKGAIYSISSHRRREVVMTTALRDKTVKIIKAVRELLQNMALPPPVNDKRCPNCSLIDICEPDVTDHSGSKRRKREIERLFIPEGGH